MGKIGFVYIWRDRKYNRYYIGCHWGTEDDGYICSSTRMRNAYKRRPNDFKRRILEKTNKKELLHEIEYNWLKQIREEELNAKYYNMNNHHYNHWHTNKTVSKSTKQKLKDNHWTKRKDADKIKEKIKMNNPMTDEKRKKISEKLKGVPLSYERSEETRKKISENSKRLIAEGKIGMKGKNHTEETKRKMSESQKGEKNHMYGKNHSDEAKEKISEASKNQIWTDERKAKISAANKGRDIGFCKGMNHSQESINKIKKARANQVFSEESKRKMSESAKGRKWYKDPESGKRVFYRESVY